MAVRTTADAVKKVLGYNLADGACLDPWMDMAAAFVDRAAACAARKGLTLTAVEEELIERNMAAHYYTRMDPVYTSRSTLGASGAFLRPPDGQEPYLANAVSLDPSGCVAALSGGGPRQASLVYLGKTRAEASDYEDRE